MRRSITHRQYVLVLGLLALFTGVYFMTWALLAHPYRAPDEPHHSNSVIRLLHGGGWPAPGEAHFGPGVETGLEESAFSTRLPGSSRSDPAPGTAELVHARPLPDAERTRITAENALPDASSRVPDQMTQHPPLYYGLVAVVLKAVGLAEARWDVQLVSMRLVSAALMTPLPLLIAAAVRQMFRSRALALSAACVPLLVPEVGHIAGSVSNDTLVTLTGALTLLGCLRVVAGDLRYRTAMLVGVALGAGLLTKGFMLAAIPAVASSYLLAPGPPTRRAWRGLVALTVAFAVGGWWWLRNLLVHGALQPAGMDPPAVSGETERSGSVYFERAWGTLTQTFWGSFSWNDLNVDPVFVVVATALGLALVLLGAATARRAWRQAIVLAGFAAIVVGSVVTRQYRFYIEYGVFAGLQGRYFYVALLGLAALAAGGVWFLLQRSERSAIVALPVVIAVAAVVVAYGLFVGLDGYYRAPGEDIGGALARWAAWSPASAELLGATVVMLTLAALAATSCAAWVAGTSESERAEEPRGRRRHTRRDLR